MLQWNDDIEQGKYAEVKGGAMRIAIILLLLAAAVLIFMVQGG